MLHLYKTNFILGDSATHFFSKFKNNACLGMKKKFNCTGQYNMNLQAISKVFLVFFPYLSVDLSEDHFNHRDQ